MIYGGTPAGSSTLNRWAYSKTKVIQDSRIGPVFEIDTEGYLRQYTYLAATCATATLTIEYLADTEEAIKCEVTLYRNDNPDVSFTVYLSASLNRYSTYNVSVPVGGTMTEFRVILTNMSHHKVRVAKISLSGATKTSTSTLQKKEFSKYAITYGLDANKPDLRGDN